MAKHDPARNAKASVVKRGRERLVDLPQEEPSRLLEEYLGQISTPWSRWERNPRTQETGRAILSAKPEIQVGVVRAALNRLTEEAQNPDHRMRQDRQLSLHSLLDCLLARRLPLTHDDSLQLLSFIVDQLEARIKAQPGRYPAAYIYGWLNISPTPRIVNQIERHVAANGLTREVRSLLRRTRVFDNAHLRGVEGNRIAARIEAMLGEAPRVVLATAEPWAESAYRDLIRMDDAARAPWMALLSPLRTDATRPSQQWLNETKKLVETIGTQCFKGSVVRWFGLIDSTGMSTMCELSAAQLRRLVWCCSFVHDEAVCRSLSRLAEACFKKYLLHEYGKARSSDRVGNACVSVLGAMPGTEPIAQLARLKTRIRHRAAQTAIQKALDAAAEKAGLAREELEELIVPSYGLDGDGRLREPVGAFTAEISFAGQDTLWNWRAPDGKLQKSVPAEVRRAHGEKLKGLKQTVADIEKMLPAQRERIESLLRTERRWPLPVWLERYLDHPLLALLTRRLIWRLQLGDRSALGIWHEGRMVDVQDRPLDWLSDETLVCLWHPIGFPPEVVLQWRRWLEDHKATQPFKQAHREVYLLTDAELNTGTYSNRFAAHILKQHQLKALCDQKGWRYRLQGGFDSGYDPCASLPLPQWGMTAEFWVDPAGQDTEALSASGINLYVSTDHVRFRGPDGEPRPLTEVPALVFTEVMRDVDLFVGVASVGNDPAWADSGGAAGYRDYWQSYAFGDLSASANTRREVLGRLLPKLKIADHCSLAGRFLVVKGNLRTYKIHLGSSNILMEPNDQYLCIVPDRASAARGDSGPLFLPFEGDRVLSLILSKAFLLAEDTKIKDPTIVSQIRLR